MSLTKLLKKSPEEIKKMTDAEKVEQFKTATQDRNVSFPFLGGYTPYKMLLVGAAIGVGVSLIFPNNK